MYWGETHWVGRAGVTTMAMAALDIGGHAKLANALTTPIALGEHVYTKYAFRDYIEK